MASSIRAPHFLAASILAWTLTACSQAPKTTDSSSAPPAASQTSSVKPIAQLPGNCSIDKQQRTATTLDFLGWAVGDPTEAPLAITATVSGNGKVTEFPTKFYDRPDIAKAYKTPALLKTGFIARIPVAEAPAGSELSLIIENSKERYRCKNTFKAI